MWNFLQMVQDREFFSPEDYYKVTYELSEKVGIFDPEGSRSVTTTLDVEYLTNGAR